MTEEALRIPGIIHLKAMCLFVRDGKLLATRGFDTQKNEAFYRLIGGGVHFQETAEVAMRREVQEELDSGLENLVFLGVAENIFTYKGVPGHEVVFLFRSDLAEASLYERESIRIIDGDAEAVWIPVADVLEGRARLYPTADYSTYLS